MNESPQEPSLPLVARNLLSQNRNGSLSTFSIKHPGFPFASIATYSVSPKGEPIFFFSSMARHSKNLKSNPKASLLVTANSAAPGGALASGRVTVIGEIKAIEESEDLETITHGYLKANPEAKQWASFGDFRFYRMAIVDVYVVAGFGSMGWVDPSQFAQATS